ncbi:MAG: EAL domain-containing protein [Gemmatimonadaceae bacterium]
MRVSPFSRLQQVRRRAASLAPIDGAAVAWLLAVRTLVSLALQAAPGVRDVARIDFENIADVLLGWMLTATAWRVSRDAKVQTSVRAGWRWIGIAYAFAWVGNVWWWYLETVKGQSPLVSWSDPIYLMFYPLFLVGVLYFPHTTRSRDDSTRYWLDVAMVIVSAGITMWYFAQFGASLTTEHAPYELVYTLGYPLGDVLILVALAVLVIRHLPAHTSVPMRYLAASMMLSLIGDSLHAWRLRHGTYAPGSYIDAIWAASYVGVAMAAWQQRRESGVAAHADDGAPVTSTSYLAYGSSALLFLVLLYVGYSTGANEVFVLALGAAAISGLAVLRQAIAVRENLRLLTESKALESEARFRALVQHSSDVILIVDVDSTVRFASPAVQQILGRPEEDLVGRLLVELVHPDDLDAALRLLSLAAETPDETPRVECRMRHGDGQWILMEHVATNLLAERTVTGIVLNSRDVSEREELQRRLTHQAFHDPLTNLANRTLFIDRTDHAMKRSHRDLSQVAMLFIDLDDFKKVNDSLGHSAGDALLSVVSARFQTTLREGDTLARLGGDEFGVLLEDCGGLSRANEVADRVQRVLREPLTMAGREIRVRVSVGIASARDASTPAELMRNADLAMYMAKTRGKSGCATYEPQMHADVVLRLELEDDLRRAIGSSQLSLVFQPIVHLDTRELFGVESLLRWRHPRHGMISPSVFIPIAEEAGLIEDIGRWVLHEAARQARAWKDETGVRIHVGVNISGRHIQHGRVLEDVRDAVAAAGIESSQLLLEITESTLMHRGDEVLDVLGGLRAFGVTLALDDFGTGYSSLSYLQRFPIDILKIDKAFIEDIARDEADPRLVRAIIALGESLNLQTVAEGIETPDQLRVLRALGCRLGQGYFFARPVAAAEVAAMVSTPADPAAATTDRSAVAA